MTNEQLADNVLKLTADLSALDQSVKSAHHRITENDRVTEGMTHFSKSSASMTSGSTTMSAVLS